MLKISKFDLLQDDYTDALAERIIDDFATGEKTTDGRCYEVPIQDITFRCAYTDDEMRGIIKTCVAVIKELISINDNGYTRDRFNAFKAEMKEETNDGIHQLNYITALYNDYKNDNLEELVEEITTYMRVGGVYLMLMAGPGFKQVINGVFERMLDDSDDENIWFSCLYFLIRGAMRMHSDEI